MQSIPLSLQSFYQVAVSQLHKHSLQPLEQQDRQLKFQDLEYKWVLHFRVRLKTRHTCQTQHPEKIIEQ